eukprot:2732159-Karenia_brevis.AAC.1
MMQWSRAETPEPGDPGCADVFIFEDIEGAPDDAIDEDEFSKYVELCFDDHMAKIVLDETQHKSMTDGAFATLRVYLAGNKTKRSAVVKDDDILTKHDLQQNATEVADATMAELKVWLTNKCFIKCLLKDAQLL